MLLQLRAQGGKIREDLTKQQYVRTIPDRKDGSPHEVITSVSHREKWVCTKDGWIGKRVEEIEYPEGLIVLANQLRI